MPRDVQTPLVTFIKYPGQWCHRSDEIVHSWNLRWCGLSELASSRSEADYALSFCNYTHIYTRWLMHHLPVHRKNEHVSAALAEVGTMISSGWNWT